MRSARSTLVSCTGVFLTLLLFASLAAAQGPPAEYPSLAGPAPIERTGSGDVAVIVAIEQYLLLPGVEGAVENANDWERFLRDDLGVEKIHFLVNAQGSREQIQRFATLAAEEVEPGGTLWFIFIGHGAPARDGTDGLLVGADANQDPDSLAARSIEQQTLLRILESGAQEQTVLVLDSCFSGRAPDGASLTPTQPTVPLHILPTLTRRTVVLTAAQSSEFAGALPGTKRPAFSYLLLGALRGWAADASGTVTAQHALRHVERVLRGVPGRFNQTPSLFGPGDLVLVTHAAEPDPGIYDLVRRMARESTGRAEPDVPEKLEVREVTVEQGQSLPSVPALSASLNPEGAIDLNVDADVLVAYQRALDADAEGERYPEQAARYWEKLGEMPGRNPYSAEAYRRAAEWREFKKKQGEFAVQRQADIERLQKVLPLRAMSEANKRELVTNFTRLYGARDAAALIAYVEPIELRADLCRPYLKTDVGQRVEVSMPRDRDGTPFRGRLLVAGEEIGPVPAIYHLPPCANQASIQVVEQRSGKVWTAALEINTASDSTYLYAQFEDLIGYSVWHDYLLADRAVPASVVSLGFAPIFTPTDFRLAERRELFGAEHTVLEEGARTMPTVRLTVETAFGTADDASFSWWVEPMAVPADKLAFGLGVGLSLGHLRGGRFGWTPARLGIHRIFDADYGNLTMASAQTSLRFHLGKDVVLRGDAAILPGLARHEGAVLLEQGDELRSQSDHDWKGVLWSAGVGIEYGNTVINDYLYDDLELPDALAGLSLSFIALPEDFGIERDGEVHYEPSTVHMLRLTYVPDADDQVHGWYELMFLLDSNQAPGIAYGVGGSFGLLHLGRLSWTPISVGMLQLFGAGFGYTPLGFTAQTSLRFMLSEHVVLRADGQAFGLMSLNLDSEVERDLFQLLGSVGGGIEFAF